MNQKWLSRILQATVITLTLAAACQELEKPREERKWHGKVAGIFPYDFRIPTIERLKESCWNPYDSRVLTPDSLFDTFLSFTPSQINILRHSLIMFSKFIRRHAIFTYFHNYPKENVKSFLLIDYGARIYFQQMKF